LGRGLQNGKRLILSVALTAAIAMPAFAEDAGVGGAPGGDLDEAWAKAGLDKISARIK
jgi:hypothetical protein